MENLREHFKPHLCLAHGSPGLLSDAGVLTVIGQVTVSLVRLAPILLPPQKPNRFIAASTATSLAARFRQVHLKPMLKSVTKGDTSGQ